MQSAIARATLPIEAVSAEPPCTPTCLSSTPTGSRSTTPSFATPCTPNAPVKFAAPYTPIASGTRAAARKPSTVRIARPATPSTPTTTVSPRIDDRVLTEDMLMTKAQRKMMVQQSPRLKKEMPKLAKTAPVFRNTPRFTRAKRIMESGETEILECSVYDKEKSYTYFEQSFFINTLLGAGSFGEVFAVESVENGKRYAIKVSLQPVSGKTSVKFREAINHMILPKHPNLVDFEEAWVEDGRMFIQQELCQRNLLDFLLEKKEISEDDVWSIFVDLVQGIYHMHTNEMLHGDIKPDNIFLTREDVCKIGDFGLVVNLKKKEEVANAEDGDNRYMALDVLNDRPTKASDIFSLGVTVLEVATSMYIPNNGIPWHLIRNGKISAKFFKNKSATLRKLVMKMIAKNPGDRPTVEELLEHPEIASRIAKRNAFIQSAEAMKNKAPILKTPRFRLDEENIRIPRELSRSQTIKSLMERRTFIGKTESQPRRFGGKVRRPLFAEEDDASNQMSNSCTPIIRNGQDYNCGPIRLDMQFDTGDEEKKPEVPMKRRRPLFL